MRGKTGAVGACLPCNIGLMLKNDQIKGRQSKSVRVEGEEGERGGGMCACLLKRSPLHKILELLVMFRILAQARTPRWRLAGNVF